MLGELPNSWCHRGYHFLGPDKTQQQKFCWGKPKEAEGNIVEPLEGGWFCYERQKGHRVVVWSDLFHPAFVWREISVPKLFICSGSEVFD